MQKTSRKPPPLEHAGGGKGSFPSQRGEINFTTSCGTARSLQKHRGKSPLERLTGWVRTGSRTTQQRVYELAPWPLIPQCPSGQLGDSALPPRAIHAGSQRAFSHSTCTPWGRSPPFNLQVTQSRCSRNETEPQDKGESRRERGSCLSWILKVRESDTFHGRN